MTAQDHTEEHQIILHAGMPKTGSTAVQQTLQRHQSDLRAAGVLYPRAGIWAGSAAHHRLFLALLDADHHSHLRTPYPAPLPDLATEVSALRAEMAASGCTTTLLSSEILWNPLAFDAGILGRLRDALPGCKITVTVALRAIPSHARSGYIQRVVGPQRYTGDFAQHVAENTADRIWQYTERLAGMAQVFGTDQVRPFWYEEARDDLLAPLRALCAIPSHGLVQTGAERANISPGWRDTAAQLQANQMLTRRHGKRLSILARLRLSLLRRGLGKVPADLAHTAAFHDLEAQDRTERRAVEQAFPTGWWQAATPDGAAPAQSEPKP